ncbi:hypothetical protein PGT21_035509 [Puccinia graminis f. sp. tritici]|uniref:Uncharacterized protein n=1 Tax=Puccinia graminis f. sp. tritici TaxID=56615 RepID=A0A5B0QLG2_PUCGR|nr:hypothetical protein PGTUg99_026357 [Puccinia graminis f. sp. tritici]KAA1084794.1 hypothetical protein PGT21_035509 [Puccinia graminis f. sp. tritici]KAA1114067.1 hypothetical protein PGTUg99_015260 [Puccinia graminis f. sp. tritici]
MNFTLAGLKLALVIFLSPQFISVSMSAPIASGGHEDKHSKALTKVDTLGMYYPGIPEGGS